ncbi:CMT3 [Scenedesmus sp. PABB004]|nr:CMT3 [Scenedesmus sp. PABB004]
MKRQSAAAGARPPQKRAKGASASPDDVRVAKGGDQQREQRATGGGRDGGGAAAQQRGPPPLAPREWAQRELPAELVAELEALYSQAQQPSEDGCWTYVGAPMPRDAVLAHYGSRRGFFQDSIASLDALRYAQAHPPAGDTVSASQVPLFHFEAVRMCDEENGEHFEARAAAAAAGAARPPRRTPPRRMWCNAAAAPRPLLCRAAPQVGLGEYVIIREEVRRAAGPGHVVEEYVGRVTEIFTNVNVRAGTRRAAPPLSARAPRAAPRALLPGGPAGPRARAPRRGRPAPRRAAPKTPAVAQNPEPRPQGERMFRIHWMYRDIDTPVAAAPKGGGRAGETVQRVLPTVGHLGHPRRLWLCGSEADNERYENCYPLESLDRKVNVFHVAPGVTDPAEVPELAGRFNPETDWFYNQFTVRDYLTFEDAFEDWLPFSTAYMDVWRQKGAAGVAALRAAGDLTHLMRGQAARKLPPRGERTLLVLELFAGGGGLSYICQSGERVKIKPGWANDINNSAAATYTANHPDTYVSCVGLEEYTQLLVKWGAEVDRYLGPGWQRVLAPLRAAADAPRHAFSRRHLPPGVGCVGSTAGAEGGSADAATAAAARAHDAVTALRRSRGEVRRARAPRGRGPPAAPAARRASAPRAVAQDVAAAPEEPDWDGLIAALAVVKPVASTGSLSGQDYLELPSAPECEAEERQETLSAYEQALRVQRERIDECRAAIKQRRLGKVLEVRDVRITDCAVRVKHGSSRNQMAEGLTDWECWLEYEVRRERLPASDDAAAEGGDAAAEGGGADGGAPEWAWEHQSLLWSRDAVLPMRRFMLAMLADKTIPLPGDVQLLTGGPPCQNVSGLNRHAKHQDVLHDPKNRLVTSYMGLISYLQPNFILMEQVTDVFKKEAAIYARYALMQSIRQNYQARAGILTAGHYGVAQGRRRALFWGARSGVEQLPPLPGATHAVKPFNMHYPRGTADFCRVEFASAASEAAAHPMVVMGDVLTDLPPVDNFDEILAVGQKVLCKKAELPSTTGGAGAGGGGDGGDAAGTSAAAAAASGSTTAGGAGKKGGGAKRGKKAGGAGGAAGDGSDAGGSGAAAAGAGDDDEDEADTAELAAEIKGSSNFAIQTWTAHAADAAAGDDTARELLQLVREAELQSTAFTLGVRRLALQAAARDVPAGAPLRDHRPLACNADDYSRMCAVDRSKGANFRDMPGVVTHGDGRCCAGSWHASKTANHKQAKALEANVAAWRALGKAGQQAVADPMSVLFDGISLECSCPGGGMPPKPPRGYKGSDGNDKHFRVDSYGSAAKGGWRGSHMPGCPSRAFFLNTGDLVCPRWCVTYKDGKSSGRHGCFGRVWWDDIQPTVVTRAEPHNLQLIHPEQDRVLTIRENARCQIGNAVAPPLAAALGRCLLLAAEEAAPVAVPVVDVPDPEYEAVAAACRAAGVGFWCEAHDVDQSTRNAFYRARHRKPAAGGAAAAGGAPPASASPSAATAPPAAAAEAAADGESGGAPAATPAAAPAKAAQPRKRKQDGAGTPAAKRVPGATPGGSSAARADGRARRGAAVAASARISDQLVCEVLPIAALAAATAAAAVPATPRGGAAGAASARGSTGAAAEAGGSKEASAAAAEEEAAASPAAVAAEEVEAASHAAAAAEEEAASPSAAAEAPSAGGASAAASAAASASASASDEGTEDSSSSEGSEESSSEEGSSSEGDDSERPGSDSADGSSADGSDDE